MLLARLRSETRDLHTRAERTGIVAEILRGRASRSGYALFLRNLLPAYEAMEHGLEDRRTLPGLSAVALPELYRSAALRADLHALCGQDWSLSLPLLPPGALYARAVSDATAAEGAAALLGHVYVRYFGDLNGGQIMGRILSRSLGLDADALAFYAFPSIVDPAAFKVRYRDAFAASADLAGAACRIVDEAIHAFELTINVSEAVLAHATHCRDEAGVPP